jgi:hypothetical protein
MMAQTKGKGGDHNRGGAPIAREEKRAKRRRKLWMCKHGSRCHCRAQTNHNSLCRFHFKVSKCKKDQEGVQNLASLGTNGNDEWCDANVNGSVDCNASIHNNNCNVTVRDEGGLVENVCGNNKCSQLPDIVVGGVNNNVQLHNNAAVSNVGDGCAIVNNCHVVDDVNRNIVGVSYIPTLSHLGRNLHPEMQEVLLLSKL